MGQRNKLTAAMFVDAARRRVSPDEAAQRFRERDARLAADTRTDAQKFLGDPDPARSALAAQGSQSSQPIKRDRRRQAAVRVDLWKW